MSGSMLTAQTELPRRNGGAAMYRVRKYFRHVRDTPTFGDIGGKFR